MRLGDTFVDLHPRDTETRTDTLMTGVCVEVRDACAWVDRNVKNAGIFLGGDRRDNDMLFCYLTEKMTAILKRPVMQKK